MPNLNRFLDAQAHCYQNVLEELKGGRKKTHWMWFTFPQVKGLGTSQNSNYYGISDLNEAKEYLEHPILGTRLRECISIVLECPTNDPVEIFGTMDSKKFQSCLTLFEMATDRQFDVQLFGKTFTKLYDGHRDILTLDMLKQFPEYK